MSQPTPESTESTPLDEVVDVGRIEALLPAARRSMFTSVLSITVFSALLFRFNPIGLGAWLVLRIAVSVVCVAGFGRLQRGRYSNETKLAWLTILMGVSGAVWGLIPAFIRPEEPAWQAVVVMWLFGNQSVITAVCSPVRRVFYVSMGTVTLTGAASVAFGSGSFGLVLALLLLLGGAYSVAIFTSLHRTVEAAITSRWEAGKLASSLARRQVELEAANENLEYLALRDGLTGLSNRRALTEQLTGGGETETVVGTGWIGFVDLDHFKSVNDHHGHRAGDEVLATVAQRWMNVLEATATLARTGGDEFVVVLPSASTDEISGSAERLLATLKEPISTSTGAIPISCSIGLAPYEDGEPLAVALARADRALYVAKERGRATFALARSGDVDRSNGVGLLTPG